MAGEFEVRWEGELPATPQEVWDAFTLHSDGWLWKIEYEPRVGGAERGLTSGGGTVTAWDPPRHFATLSDDGTNELDYRLEARGRGTFLRYRHRGVIVEDHEAQVECCRRHTALYNHSLGAYVAHFPRRTPAYVSADAPAASVQGGFARVRAALGLREDVAAGDRVTLAPGAGIEPIDGVVDWATPEFLGIRTADALYRVYGRDAWGHPVGIAHHLFAAGADAAAGE